jgi:ABC-type transporter Mla MlaB component
MGQPTLRITLEDNPNGTALKLEGRVAGPWATELARVWEQAQPNLSERTVCLDLRGTTHADASGIEVLRTIYAQTGAKILTGTPWTQYLAQKVKSPGREPDGEEV